MAYHARSFGKNVLLCLLKTSSALQYLHFPNNERNQTSKLVPPECPHHILLDNSQLNHPVRVDLYDRNRFLQ
jgi:dihydroorotase-like cyclic amidohydrolase